MSRRAIANSGLVAVVLVFLASRVNGSIQQTTQSGVSSIDYAMDLYSPSTSTIGFMDLPPLTLTSPAHTFEIQIFPRTNTQCVFSTGDQGTLAYFAIQVQSGILVVRVGGANLADPVTSIPNAISANTWQTISVIVKNINSTNALVSAFVNGALVIDNAITGQFIAAVRTKVLIGRCQFMASIPQPQGAQEANAVVDNFRVWNGERTVQEIQAMISSVDIDMNLTSVITNQNLLAFFPFHEGRGSATQNLAPTSNNDFARFTSAIWIVKNKGDTYRTCSSVENFVSVIVPNQTEVNFSPPHIVDQWEMTSCGPNFIVRVYQAPIRAWNLGEGCDVNVCGGTIINAFTVKAFDEIFHVDTNGNLTIRTLTNNSFSFLGTGAGTRPSGVRYNYQANKFFLEVPTAGYMNVDLIGLSRGGFYSAVYVYHTQFCEPFVTGLCTRADKRVSWDSFLFLNEGFCGDQYVSGSEHCDGTTYCSGNCTCEKGTASVAGLCADVCGNGIITGTEQCERTYGCTSDCKCKQGTKPVNGKCIDVCGDGTVTGTEQCDGGSFCTNKCTCIDGYKPTTPLATISCEVIPVAFVPRVNPSLDCLEVLDSDTVRVYFSYDNLDGFQRTISYGKYNVFTPSNFATTRPTVFSAGRSLTFPVSPYITNVTTSSASSLTWILGSFNLTVDLTDLTRLQCPKVPSIEIELSTSNLTTDAVQQIIDNIAVKYGIDPSRINVTVIVDATTQPPTYVLIVTINNPTNVTERDATQVISDLFEDLKQNEDKTKDSLTEGLDDIDPYIKQITTRPTGVEVRGQPTNTGETTFTPVDSSISEGIRTCSVSSVIGALIVSFVVGL